MKRTIVSLLIGELRSRQCPCALINSSARVYTPTRTTRVLVVVQTLRRKTSRRILRFNYDRVYSCNVSLPADVRSESVMSGTLPVSVLISDRMDRKEERKGLPSGSVRRSFFGRRFMHYLSLGPWKRALKSLRLDFHPAPVVHRRYAV